MNPCLRDNRETARVSLTQKLEIKYRCSKCFWPECESPKLDATGWWGELKHWWGNQRTVLRHLIQQKPDTNNNKLWDTITVQRSPETYQNTQHSSNIAGLGSLRDEQAKNNLVVSWIDESAISVQVYDTRNYCQKWQNLTFHCHAGSPPFAATSPPDLLRRFFTEFTCVKCGWDFGTFSQRMRGSGSCAQPCGRSRRSTVRRCETWMQMLKTHSMKLSMPASSANLKDQIWVPVAIDCNFMLLLFPIAEAVQTSGEHFHAQIEMHR